MNKILLRYNPWWESKNIDDSLIKRKKYFSLLQNHLSTKNIILLTGLRRVGKTSLMILLIKQLLENEIPAQNILYVSLDDYLLKDKSILEIIEEYRTLNKLSIKEKIYLFLDKIVYKKDFEIQLKNLYDSQNVKIVASASSASILGDKQHYLTGRSILIEILPLDFDEYLLFKDIRISKLDENLKTSHFEDFMRTGGIPEYVLNEKNYYLKELVDDIIHKDIAVVHNIKDVQLLQDFFLLLMERSGKQISLNKVKNILGISVDSVRRYFKMFADTYLIHPVVRYGKTNSRILNPKKIYAADLGILNHFTGYRDIGAIFENYAYLNLKNMNPMYYYKNGYEIDFVLNNKILVEVKYGRDLEGKQKLIFDDADFDKKCVIKSRKDIKRILKLK